MGDERLKIVLDHTRAMFIYHADQRIKSLNFYFVAIPVFASALGYALITGNLTCAMRGFFGLTLGIAGAVLSYCCWLLDKRNEQLIEPNKALLICLETDISPIHGIRPQSPTDQADCENPNYPRYARYGKVVPVIFGVYIVLSLLAAAISLLILCINGGLLSVISSIPGCGLPSPFSHASYGHS